ncbi:glycosyltransferase [Sphingobacterium sp. UT-1RO-CII-1]|uniref:glycosyltransferase n=1 Tax=Sphingobacterium sp. UT-1RO-CII-1 TaxID=2995225 RepID=UPI00227C7794|nr:glycosyltransferase [Sphingobacterium sp. UT-1RO-CII-1]MCY4780796.1 glycosyltransferase [Sphingobacterium sp. UT-1RO-CII-1]
MKFSVLASVYIKESPVHLEMALESVFNQTLVPDEIVLVQDGPLTTELEEVIKKYKDLYPSLMRIVPLKENKGLGNALRIGVEVCSYPIIARMDTDDVARPERLEKQIRFLKKNEDVGAVGSNIEEFNEYPGDLKRFKINPETHEELISQIALKSPFNHPSLMMRKSAILEAGNYNGDLLLFEDYSLFLRMWKAGIKFHNIQEVLLDFRVGSGIETIKRRSGKHYLLKEIEFLKYAKAINAFTSRQVLMYKLLKFPIRALPPQVVLFIYNTFLRSKK